jgi:hypothetical protein
MAPRDGLEPPTYWLQVPRDFSRAWTISSPVPRRGEGVGRFPRPVRETHRGDGVRACALVSAPSPPIGPTGEGLAQGCRSPHPAGGRFP